MNEDLAKQLSSILNDKNIDINQILDNFKANSSGENTEIPGTNSQNPENKKEENTAQNFGQFDINTIMKMQKILSLMNSETGTNQDANLLKALKPYMRDSRKEKIDQYIKLLQLLKMFEKFKEMGGNINDFL